MHICIDHGVTIAVLTPPTIQLKLVSLVTSLTSAHRGARIHEMEGERGVGANGLQSNRVKSVTQLPFSCIGNSTRRCPR